MAVERTPGGTSLIDVLDRVLDKGIVIDAWVRVSLVGIDLITVEARVVVASIDTYLKYSEAVGQVLPASRPQTELTQTVMAENAALRAQLAAAKKDVRAERVPHVQACSLGGGKAKRRRAAPQRRGLRVNACTGPPVRLRSCRHATTVGPGFGPGWHSPSFSWPATTCRRPRARSWTGLRIMPASPSLWWPWSIQAAPLFCSP